MNNSYYRSVDRSPDVCLYCKIVINGGVLCYECEKSKNIYKNVPDYMNKIDLHKSTCNCMVCGPKRKEQMYQDCLKAAKYYSDEENYE